MIEKLYEMEKKIFEEFALETSDNIHVQSVDLSNPLTSVCKIFLSDIISSQIHSKPAELPIIIPTSILIEDNTYNTYCYLEMNQQGIKYIKELFSRRNHNNRDEIIEEFRNAVLKPEGCFYSGLLNHWSGEDQSFSCQHYPAIKTNPEDACKIPYNNSSLKEIKNDEKVNYVIRITHKLHPDGVGIGLTKENIGDFLAKISVLALHTKRNRKNFAEIETFAIKAAISQVMARNMSHNIGSHVLSKYKSADDFETSEVIGKTQYTGKCLGLNSEFNNLHGNNEFAAIQRAYFNEYLKNRMDFLADIATIDHPTLESPLKFKEEILKGFDKNRILLNRISGLDSGATFDIDVKLPGQYQDIEVAIPNDVLGCQAFYIILENIIRNISKHSKRESQTDALRFLITIELCEYEANKNYYEVQIVDDVPKTKVRIDDLVKSRNNLFKETIIDSSTNRLRDTGLGSIEMDVCAAYLRKLPITAVDDVFFDVTKPYYKEKRGVKIPNLIHAYAHPVSEQVYSLGYKLYLRKPQSLLIIDDSNYLNKSIPEIEELRSKGITILGINSEVKYRFNPDSEYSHEFLIWLNDATDLSGFYEKHESILPIRVLKMEDFSNGFQLEEKVIETKKEVWKTYLDKYLKRKGIIGYNITQGNTPVSFPEERPDNRYVYIDDHDTDWDPDVKTDRYYEMCCSHHRLAKISLLNDQLNRMRYIEAVVSKIILIDERIQANIVNSNKKYRSNVEFKQYFDQLGIYIPDPKEDADLNRADFGLLKNECGKDSIDVACRLKHFIGEKLEIDKADFCVIHLGIIEKMFRENESKTEMGMTGKIEMLVGKEHLSKVIITSGRGKPTSLAGTFRYIPLAVIQNYVETLFDKLLFVNALYNSRKSK